MPRDVSATNQTEAAAAHAHVVYLVAMAFDTPVYAHSGVGTITYDGNPYLGVGGFGGFEQLSESQQIEPKIVRMRLSGVNSQYITEALDAGTFRDEVTFYQGYRQDDGTLVDDPIRLDVLYYEFADIKVDRDEVTIIVTLKTDLARLNESNGARWTAEDHAQRFAGDTFFDYQVDATNVTLEWGGRVVTPAGDRNNSEWEERDAYDSGAYS